MTARAAPGRGGALRAALVPVLLVSAGISIYIFGSRPLMSEQARLARAVADKSEQLEWMQAAGRTLRLDRHHERRAASVGGAGESLLARVDRSARAASVAIKRMEPDGAHGVGVVLEQARFDDLVGWLAALRAAHGLRVAEAGLARGADAGTVSGRLVVVDAASAAAATR